VRQTYLFGLRGRPAVPLGAIYQLSYFTLREHCFWESITMVSAGLFSVGEELAAAFVHALLRHIWLIRTEWDGG